MTFTCEHLVQYYETDQMGVVHHSNYIRWFEEARTYAFEQMGLGYKAMEEKGIISPVVGISAKYKTMAHYCDTVLLNLTLIEFSGVRFKIKYSVVNKETGDVCCLGESENCFITPEGKIMSLKRSYPDLYEKMLGFVEPQE